MTDEQDVDKSADSEVHGDSAQEQPDAASVDGTAGASVAPAEQEEPPGGKAEAGEQDIEKAADAEPDSVESDSPAGGEQLQADGEAEVPEGDKSDILSMLEGLPEEKPGATPDDINFGAASVSSAEFQQLQRPAGEPQAHNIDLLMDVDLPISIELGRTKLSIADILALGPGSVVELNKLAGEPVDLLINQKVVARGEVVVVDENFGLRITQLLTPEERLKTLADE